MLMAVSKEWRHMEQGAAAAEKMVTFEGIPSVICSTWAASYLNVDFLPLVLTDIANVHIAGRSVDAETPRIAPAV